MTTAEARFNNFLRPRKPEGSLGRAQDVHLDSNTAPELSPQPVSRSSFCYLDGSTGRSLSQVPFLFTSPGICILTNSLFLILFQVVMFATAMGWRSPGFPARDNEVIITMHNYQALINALSVHMMHINLNTIFYTHVEYLPKQFT